MSRVLFRCEIARATVTIIPLGPRLPEGSSSLPTSSNGPFSNACLRDFASNGVCLAVPVAGPAVSFYLTLSPLPRVNEFHVKRGGLLSVALSSALRPPGVTRHCALRSSDFPPAAEACRRRTSIPMFAEEMSTTGRSPQGTAATCAYRVLETERTSGILFAVTSRRMSASASTSTQTLREHFQARRRIGEPYPWEKAVEATRCLAIELALRLASRGDANVPYVYPASISFESLERWSLVDGASFPTVERDGDRDQSCVAPELLNGERTATEASAVYALAATLYEAVTGFGVGPAMARPCDVVPDLPSRVELALARALVADAVHRVPTLARFADELGGNGAGASVPPPSVEIDVDVRSSMIALEAAANSLPASVRISTSGWSVADAEELGPPSMLPVSEAERLAALKARLEADRRPRYVVVKRGIDHGPFSAVELLQQLAKGSFVATDVLRDDLGGHKKTIGEWNEFKDFATHAALAATERRDAEAVATVARKEDVQRKQSVGGGVLVLAGLAVVACAVYFVRRGSAVETASAVQDEGASSVDVEGAIKGKERKRRSQNGGGSGAGSGGFAGGGLSYEQALNGNVEAMDFEHKAGPDLTDSQLKRPLDNASFIDGCGLSGSAHATVKVAIKNGHALGVSVTTNPPSPGAGACIEAHVRRLEWPSNPKMDSMTVNY